MTGTIQIGRGELYEAVWSGPMSKLAKGFGISDVALGKICRKHGIPLPGAGYWAKVAAGKKTVKPPLPGDSSEKISISPPEKATAEVKQRRLALAHQLAVVPSEIRVPQTITRPHRFTVLTRETLKAKKPDMYGLIYASPPHGYWVAVSPAQVTRALRILDTLVKAFEKAGFEISVDEKERELNVHILGEVIPFHLREAYAQLPVPPEKKERDYYQRAYEYCPKGVLSIQLPRYLNEVKSSWGDGKNPLEENLAAVFEGFLIAAVRYKERSDELAAWRAEIKERERIRTEKEAELAQVQNEREMLTKEAQRWAECNHLRAYISYIETELKSGGKQISDAALKWVADSRTHAELLDPTGSRLRALIERA